jgi:hypothetical protein
MSPRRLRLVKEAKFEDTCIQTGAYPGNPGSHWGRFLCVVAGCLVNVDLTQSNRGTAWA